VTSGGSLAEPPIPSAKPKETTMTKTTPRKFRLVRLGEAKRLTRGEEGAGLEMATFRWEQG
jgi:hypothetical protein